MARDFSQHRINKRKLRGNYFNHINIYVSNNLQMPKTNLRTDFQIGKKKTEIYMAKHRYLYYIKNTYRTLGKKQIPQ